MDDLAPVCSTCFNRPQAEERQDGLCADCGDWQDYWLSLDEAGRRRELDMMAAYASEPRLGD